LRLKPPEESPAQSRLKSAGGAKETRSLTA
jgi:hypothetical protein